MLASSDAGEVGELLRQGLGEPTHEPVVVFCGDGERHVVTIRLRMFRTVAAKGAGPARLVSIASRIDGDGAALTLSQCTSDAGDTASAMADMDALRWVPPEPSAAAGISVTSRDRFFIKEVARDSMFVQVIQGNVTDRAALRTAMDRWLSEVEPSSIGWLGSTGGVTEDGRFILFARFSSEEEAMRNSDRPEQSAWWAETSKLFDGNATFKNSIAVDEDLVGNPDDAGFVQFVLGRMSDPERGRALMRRQDRQAWTELRPDLLGTVTAVHEGGEMTTAAYFTSEKDAHEGEAKEIPEELTRDMEEINSLTVGEPEFLTSRSPGSILPNADLADLALRPHRRRRWIQHNQ